MSNVKKDKGLRLLPAIALALPLALAVAVPGFTQPESRLGLHVIGNYTTPAGQVVRVGPRIHKIANLDGGAIDSLREYKRLFPTGVSVLRIHNMTPYTIDQNPAWAAQDYWNKVLAPVVNGMDAADRALVDYLEGPNETDNTPTFHTVADCRWFSDFWVALAPIIANAGFRPCAFSIATGNPPGDGLELRARLDAIVPALRACKKVNGAWGYHSYTHAYLQDVDIELAYSLRYRRFYVYFQQAYPDLADLPLLITEAGVDSQTGSAGKGWMGGGDAAKYTAWLDWYDRQLMRDPYVVGSTLYQSGVGGMWVSYDQDPICPWLATHIQSAKAPAARIPDPPASLTAVVVGPSSVRVAWRGNEWAAKYTVKRGPSASGPWTAIATMAEPLWTDPSAPVGVTSYYVATASSPAGESAASNAAFGTPTGSPPPPPPVAANAGFDTGGAAPDSWSLWYGAGSNADAIERDYLNIYDWYALALKGIGAGGKGARQHVPAGWIAGHQYRIGAGGRNLANSGMTYSVGYTLGNSTGAAGDGGATFGTAVAGTVDWQRVTVTFNYSGTSGVTIYLRAANAGASERAGFDKVTIEDLGETVPVAPPPPPAGQPDVVVDSVTATPAAPTAGQAASFTAVVRNAGTAATPSGVQIGVGFKIDGAAVSSGVVTGPLAAGATVSITSQAGSWTAVAGSHTLQAIADDVNRFAESNESNNTLSVPLAVASATPPPAGSNLLANGDFEGTFGTNGVASGWTPWTSAWSNPVAFARVTSPVQGGAAAQRWGRADALRVHGGLAQSFATTAGTSYTIAASLQFQSTDPGAWLEAGIDLTGQATNGEAASVVYTKLEAGGQNKWLTFTRTVAATGSRISFFLKFGQYNQTGAGPSWATVDSATATAGSAPPPPPPAGTPDLVVDSVAASPAAPVAGNAVTFSAVVRNAGTAGVAAGTTLRVSFSVDGAAVSSGASTAGLAAGASVTVTASPAWASTAGTHTVTAKADDPSIINESNESNNALSVSLPVSSATPPPAALPVVSNPSFETTITPWSMWQGAGSNADGLERDFTPAADGSFALAVKGIGTGGKGAYQYVSSGWTSGSAYRIGTSARNLVNSGMTYSIGYAPGNPGAAGAATAVWGPAVSGTSSWQRAICDFTYSGTSGVTIYLRVVNAGASERAGFDKVTIEAAASAPPPPPPAGSPDLVVDGVTANPAAPVAGAGVTFSAVVRNAGTAGVASGTTLRVSFSVDGAAVSGGTTTAGLAAGASATVTAASAWTSTSGSHTVTAKADDPSAIAESNESNNVRSASLTVSSPSPAPSPTGDPTVLSDGTLHWEAEDYTGGTTAVSGTDYYDSTAGNAGGKYRTQDVDIEACAEGGYDVGWTAAGEWMKFKFTGGGTYQARVRYAAGASGTAHIEVDGANVSGPIALAATGGYQTWATATGATFTVSSAAHAVRFVCDASGFNVNFFEFKPAAAPPPPAPALPVVANPGFESGIAPWTLWQGAGSNADPLERDITSAADGAYVLAVKGLGSGGKGACQYVSSGWVPGSAYRVGVSVRNLANAGMTYAVGVASGNTGPSGAAYATWGIAVPGSASWQRAVVDFTYAGSGGLTIYLRATNAGASERAGFDKVTVEPLASAPPPGAPDLLIDSVAADPPAPAPGAGVTFSAVVRNASGSPVPVGTAIRVGFSVDGTAVAAGSTSAGLAAGATLTVNASSAWTSTAGTHTVTAKADDPGVIAESDETNNAKAVSLSVVVVSPIPPGAKVIDVTAFGAKPDDGRDDTVAIMNSFSAIPREGPAVLVFPTGTYELGPTETGEAARIFRFSQYSNLTFDGRGSKLLCSGMTGVVQFDDCVNIRIQDLTVDWGQPPFSSGRVVAIGTDQFDLQLEVGGNSMAVDAWAEWDPVLRRPGRAGAVDAYGAINSTKFVGPGLLRCFLAVPCPVKVGATVVLRHQVYNGNAFSFLRCQGPTLSSVTVHTAPGFGLFATDCTDVTLDRWQVFPTPGTARLMSTTADGTHLGGCRGTIRMTGCRWEGMGDDAVNINGGFYGKVVGRPNASAVLWGGQRIKPPKVGDVIDFLHPTTLISYGTATANEVRFVTQQAAWYVGFSTPVPNGGGDGTLMADLTRAPKVRISDCVAGRNRARGFLIQSRDVVIERCTFDGDSGPGIMIWTDAANYWESVTTRDVVVRNCVFNDVNYGAAMSRAAVTISAVVPGGGGPSVPGAHLRIALEGNTLRHLDGPALLAGGVDGLTLTGNVIEDVCRAPVPSEIPDALFIESSRNVVITGNTAQPALQGAGLRSILSLGSGNETGTFQITGNSGF